MSHTMRTVLGGALLLGVGAAAWLRRESQNQADPTRRDAPRTGDDERRAASPGVRPRARGTRPPQGSFEPQPQDLDGGVTAALTGHNPGLMPRTSPEVEDLGLRDTTAPRAYGPSPSDVTEIYGSVVSPVVTTEGDAGMAALPGDGTADGQSWTDTLLASAAETGVPPYESFDVEPAIDRDDDIPVADRGAGGRNGI
jgi:hypothetical protein